MLRVALTGGIATGKSHVLDVMRTYGIACIDADELAHGVTATGTEASAAIAARFGSEMLAADGSVDRARLAPVVFADPAARRDLEGIVHPAVYRAIEGGLRAFEQSGDIPLAVVDIPLLFESGHQSDFQRVVVTACPPDMQVARLVARGLTEAEARQRIAAQWPLEQKVSRADFVIWTDKSFEETERQVQSVIAAL